MVDDDTIDKLRYMTDDSYATMLNTSFGYLVESVSDISFNIVKINDIRMKM